MAQDLRQVARRKAQKYGLDPDIFERQIGAESGFNRRARSPAGALGVAQIMPGTARAWGVNPMDPEAALDAAARNMARYVRKHGSYENALRAYNAGEGAIEKSRGYAETNNYVKKILGGRDPGKLGKPHVRAKTGGFGTTGQARAATPTGPPVTPEGFTREALLQQYVINRGRPDALRGLATGLGSLRTPEAAPEMPSFYKGQGGGTGTAQLWGSKIKPGGGYQGTQGVAKSLAGFGFDLGLKTQSEKRHNTNPHSGKGSDHDHGNKDAYAYDISNGTQPTPQMDRAAYRMMRELGFKDYKLGQPIDTSRGVKTITKGGRKYRVQVIYRGTGAAFGGNHLNHIHVGVKRVG